MYNYLAKKYSCNLKYCLFTCPYNSSLYLSDTPTTFYIALWTVKLISPIICNCRKLSARIGSLILKYYMKQIDDRVIVAGHITDIVNGIYFMVHESFIYTLLSTVQLYGWRYVLCMYIKVFHLQILRLQITENDYRNFTQAQCTSNVPIGMLLSYTEA